MKRQRWILAAFVCALVVVLGAATAFAKREKEDLEGVAPQHLAWLDSVDLILSKAERKAFLEIEEDYQRDAFIEAFWRARDPYPSTSRNEFRDQWEQRTAYARAAFGDLNDDRARILMFNGEPDGRVSINCADLWPGEVWFYSRAETVRTEIAMLFYKRFGGGIHHIWQAEDGIGALLRFPSSRGNIALETILSTCHSNQRDALRIALLHATRQGYQSLLFEALSPPDLKSEEWVETFHAYSTDLVEGAETFEASLEIEYPGRHQTRTVVQSILSVPRTEVGVSDLAGQRAFNILVTGEILKDGKLFENFRYRFNLPEEDITGDMVPVAFDRFLRPGAYDLIIKAEDLNGRAFLRVTREITVPFVDQLAPGPPSTDETTRKLLEEATAAIRSGETTIALVPPRGELQTGMLRLDTLTTGPDIAKVEFSLDGRPLLTKARAPYSVEIDLGSLPRMRTLTAVARGKDNEELDRDVIELNVGAHRFDVRLTEPRPGRKYERSLRAEAEIKVPDGKVVERVEFYLNETLQATLYQPPYSQAILLPGGGALSYVRAVAYQPDGNSTEDVVFVNAPEYLEEVDVQFVELFVSVLDQVNRPILDLAENAFSVTEDKVTQAPVRFDRVTNLPIHAGILLDVSASMAERLDGALQAALEFFQEAIEPRDRATLITFNDHPYLAVKFTSDQRELGGGLAGLKAERGTALYDSLVFTLHYFNGIKGQRALILLSDGVDERSRFSYEDTIEYARRAGVAIYAIGIDLPKKEGRKELQRLAGETGGRAFFLDDVKSLGSVYDQIQLELRSRYYLAYQSTNTSSDGDFRSIEVKVDATGAEANTLRGYYP